MIHFSLFQSTPLAGVISNRGLFLMKRGFFSALLVVLLAGQPLLVQAGPPLRSDAPDAYVVEAGDTLWRIASRFLDDPWRWSELWRMNPQSIANPHLIYPGQRLVLDREGGFLTVAQAVGEPAFQRLSPKQYDEPARLPVSSIPQHLIDPFLTRSRIHENPEIEEAAVLVATQENQIFVGAGDTVYARGIDEPVPNWQFFRRTTPIIHPKTRERLGYEADYLGRARLLDMSEENIATLRILESVEQMGPGDRLIPVEEPRLINYVPFAPFEDVQGEVIKIHGNMGTGGPGSVVLLDLGDYDGLRVGHVLALRRDGGTVRYRAEGRNEAIPLPVHRTGLVFVFRVFDRTAYALVMESDGPVMPGHPVRTPTYRD
jgi:hypothetical protein